MSRTLPKDRFLPSLLDRLTDDEPINNSIQLHKKNIQNIEKSLAQLPAEKQASDAQENKKQRQILLQQLNQAHAQYSVLSASVSSLKELRACVKRDLDWLLNASQYFPQEDLEAYPEVVNSVLNYGMPDLTGKTVSGFDLHYIERKLKQVILSFEPRIIRSTLVVRIQVNEAIFTHNALSFEIEGELWAEPQPLHLHLRTEFELENGNVSVFDFNP
ncbi:Type VI secretion system lysozyme-like protein [Candidatus Methylobacter favarea]|uniref:Type VI secretion system lysozyme-like protein n=1 Tax=Candidatus Methylobacter favarea TaxID=2707345 RepID=A0A8S0WME2_9GAMM|nr:type VI secretion system baseplate subunit TssE [Candidatus Methylobacter favarea]CAA9889680.1 Type VI secretion system lysozyme-like protein [Candidatus Methylobacter favarea]